MSALRVFIFLLCFVHLQSAKIENLGSQYYNWTLQDSVGEFRNLTATVPGGIYSDLMDNGIIGDILYGYNDTETRWVSKNDWFYSTSFNLSEDDLQYDNINVVFEGLDTVAAVFLNNKQIGSAENMFVRYIFNCKPAIKPGINFLQIKFTSPVRAAKSLADQGGYTIPPDCPPELYNGECHANQLRKMQASFSWDWGPAFPSMGIWKNLSLELFNSAVIRYVTVSSIDLGSNWLLNISTYLDSGSKENISGQIVHRIGTDVSEIEEVVQFENKKQNQDWEIIVDLTLQVPKLIVRQWWPNGYGDQKLYNLHTQFKHTLGELSEHHMRIGYRKIELIQEPLSTGLSFYFKVNGMPIFAKGSNEIPLDILPERGQDPALVSRVLKSAQVANMNMLRVWGGGVYESDFFYSKADELGILIWQDFMFACAMYPANTEFLQNVKLEVRHQARRLSHHPSIALWAGNNENEVAVVQNWYGTKKNQSLYKKDFRKLYVETVSEELFKNVDRGVVFLTSSPTDGKESVRQGYFAADPQSEYYGDAHYYNYILNSLEAVTYPVPRFASEFGYQSAPDVDSWLTVTDNLNNLHPDSNFMRHRQHHPLGLTQNNLLLGYQLVINNTSPNYYKAHIFYLQIVQALSIKLEVELYRSFMRRLDIRGRGNTMGALFWQLNDVWIAPTWSGIDYTGKWKMLHYYSKNFFATTIICGYVNIERNLELYVVSEEVTLMDFPLKVTAVLEVYNWRHFGVVNTTEFQTTMIHGSRQVAVLNIDGFLSSLNCSSSWITARYNCFFVLTLKSADLVLAPRNFVLPAPLKLSNIMDDVSVRITRVLQVDSDGKKFNIVITANAIAIFVWLDSHQISGNFQENGFIQVESEKRVIFESDTKVNLVDLRKALTVTHLKDPQWL